MKPRNKTYLRPRCENCGARIYRIHHPFRNYHFRKIPSHCPECGEQVGYYKKEHLIEYESLGCLVSCIVFIAIVIIAIIIFTSFN